MKSMDLGAVSGFPSTKVESYIEKVVRDSFKSEDKRGVFRYQYAILDNYVYLVTWCRYARITRKVLYRLANNFEKNFRYKLYVDHHIVDTSVGTYATANESIDINHCLDVVMLLGRMYTLDVYTREHPLGKYLNPDFSTSATCSIICAKLRDLLGDYKHYEGKRGWEQYCKDYAKIYGTEPPAKGRSKVFPAKDIIV